MPTYCYKCTKCANTKTVKQSFNDPIPTCQKSHKPIKMVRDYMSEGGAVAHFKGSGFHSTDYNASEGNGR